MLIPHIIQCYVYIHEDCPSRIWVRWTLSNRSPRSEELRRVCVNIKVTGVHL